MNIIFKENKSNINESPHNIKFLDNLGEDSYSELLIAHTFTSFISINDIFYLIYSNKNLSIISYNIINNKKINEIKHAHDKYITNFRHYSDIINRRDLIISISAYDNKLKLWNINNFECLLHLNIINSIGIFLSACFLNDNYQNYIIISNTYKESIKVFNFEGKKIKEINDSNVPIYFIDTYYDSKSFTNYIITGNNGYVSSYNYKENKIYHNYYDNEYKFHNSVIINDKEEIIKMIESSTGGNIRIWNFHTGELLNQIKIINNLLKGICLWNNEYLFIACGDKTIKLLELKSGKIIKELFGHNDKVVYIQIISHPKYGKCLLSQDKNEIKIWTT